MRNPKQQKIFFFSKTIIFYLKNNINLNNRKYKKKNFNKNKVYLNLFHRKNLILKTQNLFSFIFSFIFIKDFSSDDLCNFASHF